MTIVKEYYTSQIEMRGPDNPHAKPWETGTTVILRHDDNKPLTVKKLGELFNEAASDYPLLQPKSIRIEKDHIEFNTKPANGYKKLPNRTTGMRG